MSPTYETNPQLFNLDVTCPACSRDVRALPKSEPVYRIGSSDQMSHIICTCPRSSCNKVMFVEYDRLNRRARRVFPYSAHSASQLHPAIPNAIREDLAEARRCLSGGGYKGSVAMSRRAMQSIATQESAKGKTLKAQIDKLLRKGRITKSLHETAHEIRFFGNFGAHPQKDGLDNISATDAATVLRLVDSFVIDLYIRPHETAKLAAKRKKP
jgi:hypothetical protein